MFSCIAPIAAAYHVPAASIERVIEAAHGRTPEVGQPGLHPAGIGPMGVPAQWLPVLQAYGFPVAAVRRDPCWGIAAGTWILAVERRAAAGVATTGTAFVYPASVPGIPARIVQYANDAQLQTGVPARLLLAVAWQESGFNPRAVSPKGAQGLMQFLPATWARYGVLADGKLGSPFDPRAAMLAGARYLRHLALEFGSWQLALAGYNAGGQAVRSWRGVPPYRQTQQYVPAVLARYETLAGLPPARLSAGDAQLGSPK